VTDDLSNCDDASPLRQPALATPADPDFLPVKISSVVRGNCMPLLKDLQQDGLLPALCIVVFGYLLLSVAFHRASPPLEVSDEAGHMAYVLRVKATHRLPLADPNDHRPIGVQEITQPPLYYVLGALLIRPIDTSNSADFFHFRSSAPIGRADLPGPMNMWYPDGNRHYQQTMLAIAVLRGFSALLGLATVVLTFFAARELFPAVRSAPLFSSMLIAFNPMFLAIANSVNNDNLVSCVVAAGIFLLVHLQGKEFRVLHYAALGLIASLALLAKVSGLILLPAIMLQILRARASLAQKAAATAACGAVMAVLCGWWIALNFARYGEPLALGIHSVLAGNTRLQPDFLALFREWSGFYKSYWGVFGAFDVIYPDWVYFSLLGLSAFLVALLLGYCIKYVRTMPAGLELLLLVILMNVAALIWWTSHLTGSQGRLLFPSISAISIAFAAGIELLPRQAQRWFVPTLAIALFALCVYGAGVIIPAAYM
jgi:4-amino-4-deoxy-L-arabinose transferase-like glycosyltransferase